MPSVKLREHKSFDVAMRRFKRACEKAGIMSKLRQMEFYEKPAVKRKRKQAAAQKRSYKRVWKDKEGGFRGANLFSFSRDKAKNAAGREQAE